MIKEKRRLVSCIKQISFLYVIFTLIWARIAAVFANKAMPIILVILGSVVMLFSWLGEGIRNVIALIRNKKSFVGNTLIQLMQSIQNKKINRCN